MDHRYSRGWSLGTATRTICAFALSWFFALPAAGEWQGELRASVDYQGWTDIDDPQGEFDFVHPSVGLNATNPPSADSPLGFAIGAEYRSFIYRFDGLAFGDPWDDVHVVRIAPRAMLAVHEEWTLFGGPVFEYSGESSSFTDSIRGGAMLGAQWRPLENLMIGLGVLGMNKLADDFLIQPIILLDWAVTDRFRISTQSWTSRGGTIDLIYTATDWLDVTLSGGRERERFRLDGDLNTVGRGVGEENSLPLTLSLGWTLARGIRIETYGGFVFAGELRVEDQNGNNVGVSDFDRSWFYGLALALPF